MKPKIMNYVMQEYGSFRPQLKLLQKYNEQMFEGYLSMRMSSLPPAGGKETALSRKTKDFIIIALEVALGRGEKGKSHARKAIRLGATPKEIHEVVELCLFLAGMTTYVDSGAEAVKVAEEEYEKIKPSKKISSVR